MALSRVMLACLVCLTAAARAEDRVIRIGYQKYGTLIYEKAHGSLERALAPLHVKVTWTEFLGGPAVLEAMGAGSIDFGTTGDTPPIFAQAAGVPLVYVGVEPSAPQAEAVIVLPDSPIHSIADLKGKRVALNRGSNVHNLLVRVLQAGGLTTDDITQVYMKPSDARAAFENGSVDAWAIWDPYYAAAQTALKARVVSDGTHDGKTIDENRQFFLASRDYARANADVLKAVVEDIRRTEQYATAHRPEVEALLQPALGMDQAAVKVAVDRLPFGVQPVTDDHFASQQNIADTMTLLHLIPRKIDVREARVPAS